MEHHTVNKPNAMIQAGQKMSTVQAKIMYSILSKFKYLTQEVSLKELEEEVYTIPFKDVIPNFSQIKGGRVYELIKTQTLNLVQQCLSIKTYTNGREELTYYNLVSSAKIIPGSSKIEARISRDILPLLVNMVRDGYTQIAFKDIFKMKSTYSIRIYELLEKNRKSPNVIKQGYYEILLSDFRFYLGIEPKQYPRWNNFRARVLLSAQKEIFEKTPLRFDISYIKSGRKITGIRFENIVMVDKVELPKDAPIKYEQVTLDLEGDTAKVPVLHLPNPLLDCLQPNSRKEIEENHSEAYIKYYYNKAKDVEKKGRLKSDFASCFYAFLKNDKDLFYEKEKKKEEKKRKAIEKQKQENAKKKREEDERKAKENKMKELEKLFSNLDKTEQENYMKMATEKETFLAVAGEKFVQIKALQLFAEDNGLSM